MKKMDQSQVVFNLKELNQLLVKGLQVVIYLYRENLGVIKTENSKTRMGCKF